MASQSAVAALAVTAAADAPSLSVELSPLCSACEVAELSKAMAVIPAGTPNRERRLCDMLSFAPRITAASLASLLSRLQMQAQPFVQLVTDTVRGGGVILIPPVSECVACGHMDLSDARRGERRRTNGKPYHPTVYSERGVLRGEAYVKTCVNCGAAHHLSYAEGGSRIEEGKVLPYTGATGSERRWYESTTGTVFETSLLIRYEAQAVHSHTGWETFAEEYRAITGANDITDNFRKTLAHAWLSWTLLHWREELALPPIAMALTSDEGLDAVP